MKKQPNTSRFGSLGAQVATQTKFEDLHTKISQAKPENRSFLVRQVIDNFETAEQIEKIQKLFKDEKHPMRIVLEKKKLGLN